MRKPGEDTHATKETAEFYEKEATVYDRKRTRTGIGAYVGSVSEELVGRLTSDLTGKRVLEIGSGTGRWTSLLARQGAKVAALDISHSMLTTTREKLRSSGLFGDVCLFQANGTSLPVKDSTFDAVVSIHVFTHIADHAATAKEISRVLKPGGMLIGNYLNLLSYYWPYGLLVNAFKKSLRAGVFTRWHTLSALKRDYAAAGLRLEEVVGQVHFPSSVDSEVVTSVIRAMDRASRSSFLRYLAPTLFLRAVKV